MDIVLTVNESELDLLNFEQDLKNSLKTKGINIENINIQAIKRETVETSSTDVDFADAVNSWQVVGEDVWHANSSGQVYIDLTAGTATCSQNWTPEQNYASCAPGWYGEALINDKEDSLENIDLNLVLKQGGTLEGGPCFNITIEDDGSLSGYFLTISSHSGNNILYKIDHYAIDDYFSHGANAVIWCNGNGGISGGTWFGDTSYKILAGTAKSAGFKAEVYNAGINKNITSTITVLGTFAKASGTNIPYNIKTNSETGQITITQNGVKVIDVIDKDYLSGTYGFWGNNCEQKQSMYISTLSVSADKETKKNFTQLLREPNWREDADHFIINVDNSIDENFVDTTNIGEILTRTINDDIRFIQWGSDANQSVMENFIAQNNNNGTFFKDSDYNTLIENTANYIVGLYDTEENNNQYVIVNTPTDLEVTPSELSTNTSDEEYPNGKWIIHHNAKYFANGTGQSEYSEQYQDDLNIVFDKPGEYTIYYGEDLVKTIYAHRKPIANFSMSLNSDKTLNLVNTSYDLDSNVDTYGFGNGIVDVSWKWKKLSDETWTDGQPTFALETGESYVIQLSVVDEQGAESTYTSKYITLEENAKIPPIAAFNYTNSTIFTNNELEIINTSYDPAGNTITGHSWVLKKGNTTISTTSEPVVDFNTDTLGAGEYSYTLTVTNSLGLTSEAFTKSFTVIEDTIPPSVMIDPTYSDWGDSSAIHFEFMDSGSGFAKFRYTHSATQTPPSDSDISWSEWSANDNGSLTIDEDGVWYLHLQAQDNNGNTLNRTVGVYRIDTTNPIIERVDIDENSIERTIPITVIASDAISGLKKNAYRFVNESTGEDSGYIDSNTYNATTNGVFTIYVKDQNNNEVSIETREITKVDRVAPEILTFSTSTDQWAKSVDTQISAQDAFSGMNTYSYALEKLVVGEDDDNLDVASIGLDDLLSKDVYAQDLNDVTLVPIDVDDMDLNALSWQEDDTFTITENGTYNLYARDMADNVSAVQFTIDNVDTTPPTIEKIEYSTQDVTNQDVVITVVGAKDESAGLHKTPYSYDNGATWVSENTFSVKGNGEFSVLVRDQLENFATFSYTVENIDKILPSLEDIDVVSNREERKSTITFSVNDDRELYGYVLKNNSSLPSDDEYNTSFEVDENGNVSDETTLTANGTYYLFVKDIGGNVFSQKIVIDALVTGIDITQNQMTEYQELTNEDNASPIALFSDGIDVEGKHDTFVYVSQQSTFSAIIPKTIILDGQSGVGSYETSVVGNIAGVENIGILPTSTFSLKDVANVKTPINASVTQSKTSFGFDEILTKTTTTGTINAPDITAGSWRGELIFNILVQNNQNTIDSIASVESDSFGLVVDDSAIGITNE